MKKVPAVIDCHIWPKGPVYGPRDRWNFDFFVLCLPLSWFSINSSALLTSAGSQRHNLSNIRYTKTLTCKINTIRARLYSRKRGRKDFTTRCLIMYCMLFDCSKYLELSPSLNIQFRSSRFSFNWFARNHPPSWNSPIKIGIIDNSQNMYKSRHFVSL